MVEIVAYFNRTVLAVCQIYEFSSLVVEFMNSVAKYSDISLLAVNERQFLYVLDKNIALNYVSFLCMSIV